MKPARYNNIHLGTDVKCTAKDVELTPGPGHYGRFDGTLARTFHHQAKNQHPTKGPVFADSSSAMFLTTEGKMSPMSKFHSTVNTEDGRELRATTSNNLFSPPTGHREWQQQIQKEFSKKVQPPMLFGKS